MVGYGVDRRLLTAGKHRPVRAKTAGQLGAQAPARGDRPGFAAVGNGDNGLGAPSRRPQRQGGVMYIGIGTLILIVILLLILT